MKYLTVDFGSTYTKLTAIDAENASILGTANAFTTIDSDIKKGFDKAFDELEKKIGKFNYDQLLCCSSAAGGLKMVALGLVPALTAKAAKMAASSAGAKVVKTYSFEISKAEVDEIYAINPDLILLCGGTDGGNKEVIIGNAKHLCNIDRDFSIIVAGNKSASYELDEILKKSGKDYIITDNVMPTFNVLNIDAAKRSIKDLFIKKIIEAKGLSCMQKMSNTEIIPTPLAVMNACELLSKGTNKTVGIGDLVAVDLGGATTDIYSMSYGKPSMDSVIVKGLPEPFSKRTVEGDLGMRYSLNSLADEIDFDAIEMEKNISKDSFGDWIERCIHNPSTLPQTGTTEVEIEETLAREAVNKAVERHSGTWENSFTPMGEICVLIGKDLSEIPYIIGIGGVIIHSDNPQAILEGAKFSIKNPHYLKPKHPKFLLDSQYIFSSMGLLSLVNPELALEILKKEIKQI